MRAYIHRSWASSAASLMCSSPRSSAAFFFHGLGLEPATVALAGAEGVLVVTRQSARRRAAEIEWPTLFFFLGLFVMVGALEETGAIGMVADGSPRHRRRPHRRAARHRLDLGARLGRRRQHPLHRGHDPRRRGAPEGNAGDDAYWWASPSAPARRQRHADRRRRQRRRRRMASRAGHPIGFMDFLRVGVPATLLSMLLATLTSGAIRELGDARTRREAADPQIEPLRRDAGRGGAPPGSSTRPAGPSRWWTKTGGLVGIFGEREFMAALFPGYVGELAPPGWSPGPSTRRSSAASCRYEPVSEHLTTDHVDRRGGLSRTPSSPRLLHHRVLIVPSRPRARCTPLITRNDYFRELVKKFEAAGAS